MESAKKLERMGGFQRLEDLPRLYAVRLLLLLSGEPV